MNLIGEHVDYEGYSVLPMAIRQDTMIAIRKNESEKLLRIANVNDKYEMCTYPADPMQVPFIYLSQPCKSLLSAVRLGFCQLSFRMLIVCVCV